MDEMWSYERQKRFDTKGRRWHFVRRYLYDDFVAYEERPFELYFRDDERTEFGLLRFERLKDNPYRDYAATVNKIMNDEAFRKTLLRPETRRIWAGSWK